MILILVRAIAGNPCKGVRRNPETPCERFFSEAEICALAEALNLADERSGADCIRIVMLSGSRPAEAMGALWSEFEESGFWCKPAANTKQRRVRRVPLNAGALELVEDLRQNRKGDSPWVFSGRGPSKHITTLKTVWRATRRRAQVLAWLDSLDPAVSGLVSSLHEQLGRLPTLKEAEAVAAAAKVTLPASLATARLYDLRHTFASAGAGLGMGLPMIGKLLGHTQPRTTQRYSHLADQPMIEATEQIGKQIQAAVKSARRRKAKAATL